MFLCHFNEIFTVYIVKQIIYGFFLFQEQGHKEITIWLSEEPRYVSGVTNKTTCNDIIKALIDDEISNGNYEYCQRLKGKNTL